MTGKIPGSAPSLPKELAVSPDNKKVEGFTSEEVGQYHAYQVQLKNGDLFHHVDAKRFALMVGDAFIAKTQFEGGAPTETYRYWNTLLTEMKEGKSNIRNALSKEQIDAVLKGLNDCLTADQLFKSNGRIKGNGGEAARTTDMKELLRIIDQSLDSKSRRFVLPLQYADMGASGGHVFCAVLEKNDKNQIICTILDRGDGCELHPIVSRANKDKRNYHFYPIMINDPNLFKPNSEVGLMLLQILQKYQFPHENAHGDFKGEEIYNLILQVGTLLKDSSNANRKDIGVTSQRGGTCSEQVVNHNAPSQI